MGLGLQIRAGQKLAADVYTRPEIMAAHLEMLLDAVSKACGGAGTLNHPHHRLAMNTLIGNFEYIVDSKIPICITIWFLRRGHAVATVELEFDWAGMQMKINQGNNTVSIGDFSGGGTGSFAIPDEVRRSNGGGLPLPELRGHANLLEEIITELSKQETFNSINFLMEYPGRSLKHKTYSVFVGNVLRLLPRSDFERRLKMEPRSYSSSNGGVRFDTLEIRSETNPDLIMRVRKRAG